MSWWGFECVGLWVCGVVSLWVDELMSWWVGELIRLWVGGLVGLWVDVLVSCWAFKSLSASELFYPVLRIWEGFLSCVGITRTTNSSQFVETIKVKTASSYSVVACGSPVAAIRTIYRQISVIMAHSSMPCLNFRNTLSHCIFIIWHSTYCKMAFCTDIAIYGNRTTIKNTISANSTKGFEL